MIRAAFVPVRPPVLRLAVLALAAGAALLAVPASAADEAPRPAATTAGELPRSAVVSAGEGTRAVAVPAEAAPDRSHADPVVECESAVNDSLRELRGSGVQGVAFTADAHLSDSDAGHIDVKGAGHYRRGAGKGGAVDFRYTCVFDRASGTASGVMLHDASTGVPPALPVWQADITRVSPPACESAVADRLQRAHARASGITFDSGARKLEPARDGRTALAGTGRLVRAPGMAPAAFRYRCEFDAGGQLADASANE